MSIILCLITSAILAWAKSTRSCNERSARGPASPVDRGAESGATFALQPHPSAGTVSMPVATDTLNNGQSIPVMYVLVCLCRLRRRTPPPARAAQARTCHR